MNESHQGKNQTSGSLQLKKRNWMQIILNKYNVNGCNSGRRSAGTELLLAFVTLKARRVGAEHKKAAAMGLLLPQVAAEPHVSRADPGPRRTQSHGGRLGLWGRRGVSGLHSCPKQPGGRSKGLGRLGRDWQRRGRKSGPRGRGRRPDRSGYSASLSCSRLRLAPRCAQHVPQWRPVA